MIAIKVANDRITVPTPIFRNAPEYVQVDGEVVFTKPFNWNSSATVELKLQTGNDLAVFANIERTITPVAFGVSTDGIVNSSGNIGDSPSAKFKVQFVINPDVKPGVYVYVVRPEQVDDSRSLQGQLDYKTIAIIVTDENIISQQELPKQNNNLDLLSISKIFPRTVGGNIAQERTEPAAVLLRCPAGKVLKINTLSLVARNAGSSWSLRIALSGVTIAWIEAALQSPLTGGVQGAFQPGAYLNYQERVLRQTIIDKNQPIYLTPGQVITGRPEGTYEGKVGFSYMCSYEELEF